MKLRDSKQHGESDSAGREPALQSLVCPRCGCGHLPVLERRVRNHHRVVIHQCRHCGKQIRRHEHKLH